MELKNKKLEVIVRALEEKANSSDIKLLNRDVTNLKQNLAGQIDKTPDSQNHGEIFNDYTLNEATGLYSHAEGYNTTASGHGSHSEGGIYYYGGMLEPGGTARGDASHAEGHRTTASGVGSHAEGDHTKANNQSSHAEGSWTTANGRDSHAEGASTIANNEAEHAEGKFNKSNTNTVSSIGIGTSDKKRKNAVEVMDDGKVYVHGIGNYDGINPNETNSVQAAFLKVVNKKVIVKLTLAEYDALTTKDDDILYCIIG